MKPDDARREDQGLEGELRSWLRARDAGAAPERLRIRIGLDGIIALARMIEPRGNMIGPVRGDALVRGEP